MSFQGSAQVRRNLKGLPDTYYMEDKKTGKYYDIRDFKPTDDEEGWVLRDPEKAVPMSKSTRTWNRIDGLGAIWIRYLVITFLLSILFTIIGAICGFLFASKSSYTTITDKFKNYI
jgi:hypothetical protein